MESIYEYAALLNDIQSDLTGILITLIVTSTVTLISLIINTILQIHLLDKEYKRKQYEIMRENYPLIRNHLTNLYICYKTIEESNLYGESFKVYEFINLDWNEYRRHLSTDEVDYVDEFKKNVNEIIEHYNEINKYFEANNFPSTSIKIKKIINELNFYCISTLNSKEPDQEYSTDKIKKIITILDKNYNTFW